MQSSYQIRLTKLKTCEEWRHVSSKSIEKSKLHLDAIQATMMILFNVKVFSSTLQTSSLIGMTTIRSVKSFKSTWWLLSPRAWWSPRSSDSIRPSPDPSQRSQRSQRSERSLSNHKKIFESSIWQIFIGPGSSHSEHSLPHWGKPLARVWPEHLTWRYPAIQARFGKIKPDTKCLNALKYTTSDGKLLLLIEQSEQ